MYSTATESNTAVRKELIARLDKQRKNLTNKIERLISFPILGEPCEASDSDKVVFECWCAECKEIASSVIKHGVLPEWLR